jgi:GntR family transcriptional regulator
MTPEPAYRRIAAELRAAILRGDYPPGAALPRLVDLTARYGVSRTTIQAVYVALEAEGLVEAIRRRGTVVRQPRIRKRITRDRLVYRDDRGYYFDATAQPWTALAAPTITWGPAPLDLIDSLGVAAGENVLIRDRIMGDADTRDPQQLATSYLPPRVARNTILAEPDTGPGGIYDRMEEMGHAPLKWSEAVTARAATPTEVDTLRLAPGVPVLRILRTTLSGTTAQVLEINDTRLPADRYEIGYQLRRSPTAPRS